MKKVILIIIPIALIGVGFGLAKAGIINLPGVSPKAKSKSAGLYKEAEDPKVAEKKPGSSTSTLTKKSLPPPTVKAELVTETKPEVGVKKLAKLWNEMEAPALVSLVKDWKDSELAAVLIKMDGAKVAELLSALEPKRASSLSRELQKQASVIPANSGA